MSNFEEHKETDDLEVFFNKTLYESSMQPSEKSWENIEQSLNQEGKRKKRFLWFFLSGLILVVGTTSAWYILDNLNVNKSVIVNNVNKSTNNPINQKHPLPQETNVATHEQNTRITDAKENKSNPIISEETKIQIGAFSKKINLDIFKQIQLPIQSEITDNGITKYFVLSQNKTIDLETIKGLGFTDAFVKENHSVEYKNIATTIKNTTSPKQRPEKSSTVSVSTRQNNIASTFIAKKKELKNKAQVVNTDYAKNLNMVSSNPVAKHNEPETKPKSHSGNNITAIVNNSTIENKEIVNENVNAKNNPSAENFAITATQFKDSVQVKEPDSNIKIDSIKTITKTDSVQAPLKKEVEKDSIKTGLKNRWAISLIGGPNVFLNQTKTTLFDSKTEIQPMTYSGELKVEYCFLKNLSASIGIGYQGNNIQKDSTRFKFSKYIVSDYIVNSSFGPMAIDKNTLLQGFFLAASIDTFYASYKYTSTIKSINIPLQINWCFLNQSKLQLYTGLGVNTSYIISQESHLTLKKENNATGFYYKNVDSNRLNAILLLSLSCDVRLTKRLYFTATPSYRYSLTNYSATPGIVFKPVYLSLMGGLKIKF